MSDNLKSIDKIDIDKALLDQFGQSIKTEFNTVTQEVQGTIYISSIVKVFYRQFLANSSIGKNDINTGYGITWGVSSANELPDRWLLATPYKVFGKKYNEFESSHSNILFKEIELAIRDAKKLVDITLLTPPTGKFLKVIAEALASLESKSPIVRILYSEPINKYRIGYGEPVYPAKDFLSKITKKFKSQSSAKIYVACFRGNIFTWNHAKIIAVDGRKAIVGGHNLWEKDYLKENPVFDVSIQVSGLAAIASHNFATSLWEYLVRKGINGGINHPDIKLRNSIDMVKTSESKDLPRSLIDLDVSSLNDLNKEVKNIVKDLFENSDKSPRKVPMMGVGRLDSLGETEANQSDLAILTMINCAKKSIYLSLQSLGPIVFSLCGWPYDWPIEILSALYQAMSRNVNVSLFLSNPKTKRGYDGDELREVYKKFLSEEVRKETTLDLEKAKRTLNKLKLAYLRYSKEEDTYPNGRQIPNHAKTILVDKKVFYIGSQNLYQSNHSEFGYIVEDQTAADQYYQDYWKKLEECSSVYEKDPNIDKDAEDLEIRIQVGNVLPNVSGRIDIDIIAEFQHSHEFGAFSKYITVYIKPNTSNSFSLKQLGLTKELDIPPELYLVLRSKEKCFFEDVKLIEWKGRNENEKEIKNIQIKDWKEQNWKIPIWSVSSSSKLEEDENSVILTVKGTADSKSSDLQAVKVIILDEDENDEDENDEDENIVILRVRCTAEPKSSDRQAVKVIIE